MAASDWYTRNFLGKSPFFRKKSSLTVESLKPTPVHYRLQNFIVFTSTIPNVPPNLKTFPRIFPYLRTLSLIAKNVSQYRKKARLPTFIRCKIPTAYVISLSDSGNTSVLPILLHCSLS